MVSYFWLISSNIQSQVGKKVSSITSSLAHRRRGRRTVFLKAEKEMRVKMQRFIVTFLPTLLLFFGIKPLSHIFYIFLYINNKNSQQCFPKIVTYSSLAYIFCIFSKVRDLCVRIRQTGYGRNFSSNLGFNV